MSTSPLPALPADPPALIARQTTTEVDPVRSMDSGREAGQKGESGTHRTRSEASADPDGTDVRVEITLFEADRDPDERTTRWITADKSDCVPEAEWR